MKKNKFPLVKNDGCLKIKYSSPKKCVFYSFNLEDSGNYGHNMRLI